MLLQRIAKIALKQKIHSYLSRKEFDKLPHNLAVKKAAHPPSKKELHEDIFFYV